MSEKDTEQGQQAATSKVLEEASSKGRNFGIRALLIVVILVEIVGIMSVWSLRCAESTHSYVPPQQERRRVPRAAAEKARLRGDSLLPPQRLPHVPRSTTTASPSPTTPQNNMPAQLNSTRITQRPAPLIEQGGMVGKQKDNVFCIGNLLTDTPTSANEGAMRILLMVSKATGGTQHGEGKQVDAYQSTAQILHAPALNIPDAEVTNFHFQPAPTFGNKRPEYALVRYEGLDMELLDVVMDVLNGTSHADMQAHGGINPVRNNGFPVYAWWPMSSKNDTHRRVEIVPDGPGQAANFLLLATEHPTAFQSAIESHYTTTHNLDVCSTDIKKKGPWDRNTSEKQVFVTLPFYDQATIDNLCTPIYGNPHVSLLNLRVKIPGAHPIDVRCIHKHKVVRASLGPNTVKAMGFDMVPSEAAWAILAYSLAEEANLAGIDGHAVESVVIEGNGQKWDPTIALVRLSNATITDWAVNHKQTLDTHHPDIPIILAATPLRLVSDWMDRDVFVNATKAPKEVEKTQADTERENVQARVVAEMSKEIKGMREEQRTQREELAENNATHRGDMIHVVQLIVTQGMSTNQTFTTLEAQRRYDSMREQKTRFQDRILFDDNMPPAMVAKMTLRIEEMEEELEEAKQELDAAKQRGKEIAGDQTRQHTKLLVALNGPRQITAPASSASPGRLVEVDTPEARIIELARKMKKRPAGIAKLTLGRTTSAPQARDKDAESNEMELSETDEDEEGDVSVSLLHTSPGGTRKHDATTSATMLDNGEDDSMDLPQPPVPSAPAAAVAPPRFSFKDIAVAPQPPVVARPVTPPPQQSQPYGGQQSTPGGDRQGEERRYGEWDNLARTPDYGMLQRQGLLPPRTPSAAGSPVARASSGKKPLPKLVDSAAKARLRAKSTAAKTRRESGSKEGETTASPSRQSGRLLARSVSVAAAEEGSEQQSEPIEVDEIVQDSQEPEAGPCPKSPPKEPYVPIEYDLDDCDIQRDWTHRNKDRSGEQILDRVAHSFGPGDVQVERKGSLPATDHRPIWAKLFLPLILPDTSAEGIPNPLPRRLNLPTKGDADQAKQYAELTQEGIKAAELQKMDVRVHEDWDCVHKELSRIFRAVGEIVFGVRGTTTWKPKGPTPEIRRKQQDLYHLNQYIRAMKEGRLEAHLSHKKKRRHALDITRQVSVEVDKSSEGDAAAAAAKLRSRCAKDLWKMEIAEVRKRAQARARFKLKRVLHGASVKQVLLPRGLQVQPAVITDEATGTLVADPEGVRSGIRSYVKNLYTKALDIPPDRPWLQSEAAARFQEGAVGDPFLWPPNELGITQYRAVLRKGNRAPSPGPDGWEKWALLLLTDESLAIPLGLLNTTLQSNYYSDFARQSYLLPWYKRGAPTELGNYRFVAFSCQIPMQAASIFSTSLQDYSERRGLIPPEQIATQKGVQGRDSLSFLAQLDCAAKRLQITLYDLLRDQKKGFDLLLPEAGYDAYEFFGIGKAAAEFDRVRLAHCDLILKTPYGAAEPFRTEGQVKQGDPPSPVRFSLAMAMGTYWVREMVPEAVVTITTMLGNTNAEQPVPHYHTPADLIKLETQAVAAMDDTRIWATSVAQLSKITYLYEVFQETYGSRTDWEKKTHVTIIGKMPLVQPETVELRGTDGMRVVKVVKDYTFLRTDVNNATLRYQECLAIVENAVIPAMETQRLPQSAVIKVIEQTIISKLRAKVAYQPLRQADAIKLDAAVTRRVQKYFDWVFPLASQILSVPLRDHGFGITSMAAINRTELVTGLLRDLNHHLEPYRKMAQITLADLQCTFNHCRHPLTPGGLSIGPLSKMHKYFPVAWVEAIKELTTMKLSIWQTDQQFIGEGNVALKHVVWMREPKGEFGTSLRCLEGKGVFTLRDATSANGPVNSQRYEYNEDLGTVATAKVMGRFLQHKDLTAFVNGPAELMVPREERRRNAETRIISTAKLAVKRETGKNPFLYATDGSAYGTMSATGAIVGPAELKTIMPANAVSSMHGELAALVVMTLTDDAVREINRIEGPGPSTVALTDYQNAVTLAERRDERQKAAPLVGTAAPIADWLRKLLQERPHVQLEKVRAHTGKSDMMSLLNDDADNAAAMAHGQPDFHFPYPTWCLPPYALHTGSLWHEGSVAELVGRLSATIEAARLPEKTKATMETLKRLKKQVRFHPRHHPNPADPKRPLPPLEDLTGLRDHLRVTSLDKSTLKNYEYALKLWTTFAHAYAFNMLPSKHSLSLFIAWRFTTVNYVCGTLSALAFYLRPLMIDLNPDWDQGHSAATEGQKDVLKWARVAIAPGCDYETLYFAARLIILFFCCGQAGEITMPDNKDFRDKRKTIMRHSVVASPTSFEATIPYIKNDPLFTGSHYMFTSAISEPIFTAVVYKFIQARDAKHGLAGPLFLDSRGKESTRSSFVRKMKKLLGKQYTGHSGRCGGATYYVLWGIDHESIQRLGRWKSNAWLDYIRVTPALQKAILFRKAMDKREREERAGGG
ncbi:hypothetical protein P7C70_g2734, partial [Phenoliferia sp. Uapishka_3]